MQHTPHNLFDCALQLHKCAVNFILTMWTTPCGGWTSSNESIHRHCKSRMACSQGNTQPALDMWLRSDTHSLYEQLDVDATSMQHSCPLKAPSGSQQATAHTWQAHVPCTCATSKQVEHTAQYARHESCHTTLCQQMTQLVSCSHSMPHRCYTAAGCAAHTAATKAVTPSNHTQEWAAGHIYTLTVHRQQHH
jgi:hypothetical protein